MSALDFANDIFMVCQCGESIPPHWFRETRSSYRKFIYDVFFAEDEFRAVTAACEVDWSLDRKTDPCFELFIEGRLEITSPDHSGERQYLGGGFFRDGDYESIVSYDHTDRLQLIAAKCGWNTTLHWLVFISERLYAPATLFFNPNVLYCVTECPLIVDVDMRYGTADGEIDRAYTKKQLQEMFAREKHLLWKIIAKKLEEAKIEQKRQKLHEMLKFERNRMTDSAYGRLCDGIDEEYSANSHI